MSIEIDLRNRRALVTGGSRGIGRAIVNSLAAAGAQVGFSYRQDKEAADSLVGEAKAKGVALRSFRCDLASDGAAEDLVAQFCQEIGEPDILVANAGIWEGAPLEDLTSEHLMRTLKINVDGVAQSVRSCARFMKKNGSGRIVVIGSTAGQRGEANYSQYAASKGAVHLFVKSVAVELAPFGINVNTVAPGWVKTDMTAPAMAGSGEAEIAALIPRGLVAEADDIAGPVLFLCSSLSNHMIGTTLSVNGGSVLD
ncbi:MAG: 3-oxoacyl-[acyl-carrier protein] reductase [Planctomycetota bacterium]|jgi:3-oxoacyl-[acyl-carrier protein] reductase